MERLIVIITWFCLGTILLITWLGLLQTGYILQTCSSTTTAVNLPQSKFTVTTETVQTTDKVTVRKKIAHEKYGLRQLFVDNFCNKYIGSDEKVTAYNLDHGGPMDWTRHLYYDYNHGMMFCPINKVGSSTWFDHFLRINGYTNAEVSLALETFKLPASEQRPRVKDKLFPLLDDSIGEANTHLMSFVFVRHPVIRLISAFEDKFLRHFNKIEFIRYVLDEANNSFDTMNWHVKPLWTACPFCAFRFDVIGHLEDADEDTRFIVESLNLTDNIDVSSRRNSAGHGHDERKRMDFFFENVPKDLIKGLFEYVRKDFELLGYDVPWEYL